MKKVLIVEDNHLFRRILHELLQQYYPHTVIAEASNGFQAIESVKDLEPHVVLMDIRLPGPNGFKLTRRIKKIRPLIKVILITSHNETAFRKMALAVGADRFLCKDELNGDTLKKLL